MFRRKLDNVTFVKATVPPPKATVLQGVVHVLLHVVHERLATLQVARLSRAKYCDCNCYAVIVTAML
jgi:hypothetical protein